MTTTPFLRFIAALQLFASAPLLGVSASQHETCKVAYEGKCDAKDFSATTNIFFRVESVDSNAGHDTFNATLTYHWGDGTDYEVGTVAYDIGADYGFGRTQNYTDEGMYMIGYTLVFEDDHAAACSGQTYTKLYPLKMELTPSRCQLPAPTDPPTPSPTVSAGPTVSSSPTGPPMAIAPDANETNGVYSVWTGASTSRIALVMGLAGFVLL